MSLIITGFPNMRLIVTAVVMVALIAMSTSTTPGEATATGVPSLDTEDGRISGILEKSQKGREFYSFYGIPFAKPPLGKLRFKVTQNTIFMIIIFR